MLLNVLSFVLLVQVTAIYGFPDKFMIKNQKTGRVLDDTGLFVATEIWANKKSQVWSLEQSSTPGYYFIRNWDSQNVLHVSLIFKSVKTWLKLGLWNQMWKVEREEDTRLYVKLYRNDYLTDDGRYATLSQFNLGDNSDKWILAEIPQVPLVATRSKGMHVLKSVKTDMVLEDTPEGLLMTIWQKKDTQIWKVLSTDVPDNIHIKNVGTGKFLHSEFGAELISTKDYQKTLRQKWVVSKDRVFNANFRSNCLYQISNTVQLKQKCDGEEVVLLTVEDFEKSLPQNKTSLKAHKPQECVKESNTSKSGDTIQEIGIVQLVQLQEILKKYSTILNAPKMSSTNEKLFLIRLQKLLKKYPENGNQNGVISDPSFFLDLQKLVKEYSINNDINTITHSDHVIMTDELFIIELQNLLTIYSELLDSTPNNAVIHTLFLGKIQSLLEKYLIIFDVPQDSKQLFFAELRNLLEKNSAILNETPKTERLNKELVAKIHKVLENNTNTSYGTQEGTASNKLFLQKLQKLLKKYLVLLSSTGQCNAYGELFLLDLVELQESVPLNNTEKCQEEVSVKLYKPQSNTTVAFISTRYRDLVDISFLDEILHKLQNKFLVPEEKIAVVVISTQEDDLLDGMVLNDLVSKLDGKFSVIRLDHLIDVRK